MSNVKCPLSSSKILKSGAPICPSVCCKDTAHSSSIQIPKPGALHVFSVISLGCTQLLNPPSLLHSCLSSFTPFMLPPPPPPTEPFWAPLVQGLQCVISMLDKYYAYLLLPGTLLSRADSPPLARTTNTFQMDGIAPHSLYRTSQLGLTGANG
jgi:hypothetical protein